MACMSFFDVHGKRLECGYVKKRGTDPLAIGSSSGGLPRGDKEVTGTVEVLIKRPFEDVACGIPNERQSHHRGRALRVDLESRASGNHAARPSAALGVDDVQDAGPRSGKGCESQKHQDGLPARGCVGGKAASVSSPTALSVSSHGDYMTTKVRRSDQGPD